MLRYVIKRILWLIPVILVVAFIVFALMELAPGTIIDVYKSEYMTPEDLAALEAQFNLDKPLIYRYGLYMLNLVRGDLGVSDVSKTSVWETYMARLPNTLLLSFTSLIIGSIAAVPLGIIAARRAGKIVDNAATTFSLIGMSMPGFWLGILLLMLFSLQLGWFPAGGMENGIRSLILPAVCSALILMATTTRQTRSSMLEVLNADFLRTARAKGVPEDIVVRKHALGNAWIPILTMIGMSLSVSLAGSVVVESVFAWPGVGRMAAEAVLARDVTATLGCVTLTTIIYVLVNLIVDLLYAFVDPRIRSVYASKRKKTGSEAVGAGRARALQSPDEYVAAGLEVLAGPDTPALAYSAPDDSPAETGAAAAEINAAVTAAESAQATTASAAASDVAIADDILCGVPRQEAYAAPEPDISLPDARSFVTVDRDAEQRARLEQGAGSGSKKETGAEYKTYEQVIKQYRKRSQFGEILHHIRQNKGAMAGLFIVAVLLVALIVSLFISFESITMSDVPNRFARPGLKFPFGTDNLGRNNFLRAIYGTRYSLAIGLGVVGISILFGVPLGSVAGYYGGLADDIIMRISDTLASIPGMLLGMVIVTVLGQSLRNLIIAVGVTSVPIFIRITRASILTIRNNEYVEAARAIGYSDPRIVFTQVLPNGLAPIIVTITSSLGIAILIAASLSYLGFGVPVPHPEWGSMISRGKEFARTAPWLMTYPGLCIMITVLAFNLMGDGLRDALDPKLKK